MQVRAKSTGIGKRHALVQSLMFGGFIQAVNPVRIAFNQGQGERAVYWACPQNPVTGQTGKPQRGDPPGWFDAGSNEHTNHTMFLICS